MAVANEAVVICVNYIQEMSQKDGYFNRISVTKRSCGCTVMFHFDNVSKSSTMLTVQNTGRKTMKTSCYFRFSYLFASILYFTCDHTTYHESRSQKNPFAFISFGKIQFLPPCI